MTLILTDSDITMLQGVTVQAMPDTATLSRVTSTVDAVGGIAETWTTIGTYPCHIAVYLGRKGGDELAQDERFASLQYFRIVLPGGTDVGMKDRLTVNGRTYEVKGVAQGQSTWEALVEVFCVEVQ